MIKLKSQLEIEKMREAGKITAGALEAAREVIKPGITTNQIDTVIRKYIESHGAKPSFLGYAGFPASACISVNDEVIHGIPDSRHLADGDIQGGCGSVLQRIPRRFRKNILLRRGFRKSKGY